MGGGSGGGGGGGGGAGGERGGGVRSCCNTSCFLESSCKSQWCFPSLADQLFPYKEVAGDIVNPLSLSFCTLCPFRQRGGIKSVLQKE